jgi:hypothetical protein
MNFGVINVNGIGRQTAQTKCGGIGGIARLIPQSLQLQA